MACPSPPRGWGDTGAWATKNRYPAVAASCEPISPQQAPLATERNGASGVFPRSAFSVRQGRTPRPLPGARETCLSFVLSDARSSSALPSIGALTGGWAVTLDRQGAPAGTGQSGLSVSVVSSAHWSFSFVDGWSRRAGDVHAATYPVVEAVVGDRFGMARHKRSTRPHTVGVPGRSQPCRQPRSRRPPHHGRRHPPTRIGAGSRGTW